MVRLAALFVAAAIVVAVPFFVWGDGLELSLSQDRLLAALGDSYGYAWAAGILLILADLLLPIPSTIVMATMGVMYGPLLGGAISAAGLSLSGLLGYGLCRALGRPAALKLVGARELDKGEALFNRSGGWIVAASRPLPILAEVVACLAGIAAMPFRAFALALLCGTVPFGFLVAAAGHFGRGVPVATLVVCALLPLPFWYVLDRLRRRGSPGEATSRRPP